MDTLFKTINAEQKAESLKPRNECGGVSLAQMFIHAHYLTFLFRGHCQDVGGCPYSRGSRYF